MTAGRELDALVAEKVMGCQVTVLEPGMYDCGCPSSRHQGYYEEDGEQFSQLARYTTDIAAAWEVRNAFHDRLFSVRMRFVDALQEEINKRYFEGHGHFEQGIRLEKSYSLLVMEPIDICLAALRAVGVEVPA